MTNHGYFVTPMANGFRFLVVSFYTKISTFIFPKLTPFLLHKFSEHTVGCIGGLILASLAILGLDLVLPVMSVHLLDSVIPSQDTERLNVLMMGGGCCCVSPCNTSVFIHLIFKLENGSCFSSHQY